LRSGENDNALVRKSKGEDLKRPLFFEMQSERRTRYDTWNRRRVWYIDIKKPRPLGEVAAKPTERAQPSVF
jgi:hypothetical protein